MVRFSDIIKIKDKKGKKFQEPPPGKVAEDKFRLSETLMLKSSLTEEKEAFETKLEQKDSDLESVAYYEKFIKRAVEAKERVKKDQGISPSPILSDLHSIINKKLHNLF